ncbi:cGMP-specific 3',5'-cyclic phosphodiesterase-like [Artemia franciscana]|uniref:cGMP-specific 3',5'-cyclic phosphodiesterase-like n=1 Tax=Artemia franciscana TaxID=6661 RepID=UPI0032DBA7B9
MPKGYYQGSSTSLSGLVRPITASESDLHTQSEDMGLFMELVRDIATELDLDTLCYKILTNVNLLTCADRASLFLVEGTRDSRYLVPKLFDVSVESDLEVSIEKARSELCRIPLGVGIAGQVALSKEAVRTGDAYKDERFSPQIDEITGYRTQSLVCLPICNQQGEVLGVAEIINKIDDGNVTEFCEKDVELFKRYLTFAGIGIQNATLFEISRREFVRNQILLNLAKCIFEEQSTLEDLLTRVIAEASQFLECERCAVYVLDSNREDEQVFQTAFQLRCFPDEASDNNVEPAPLDSPYANVAKYVANTTEILRINDLSKWSEYEFGSTAYEIVSHLAKTDPSLRSLVALPICHREEEKNSVVGVALLVNKNGYDPFSEDDVQALEAFSIFCGLGIHNTVMYENVCKLMAKQKVALELLSFHAMAADDDVKKLKKAHIPSGKYFEINSYAFNDFQYSDEETCYATIRMFMDFDLINKFQIPYDVLCCWVLSVKKNYRPVKYHNWRHALNVAQTMFALLKTGKMERFMHDIEILGLLIACLSHDLDHRGTNNAFQTKAMTPLATLYSTSTMEHHHFNQCAMILSQDAANILKNLSPSNYRLAMSKIEHAILATDLAIYFKKKSKFIEMVENGEWDWQDPDNKELLCAMMMTACDLSAIAKPWEIQHQVAKLVAEEFFDQGDIEKLQLNSQPIDMLNRDKKDDLPKMQIGFIDAICLPLYKALSESFPWVKPLYQHCAENRENWMKLAELVDMGLTWIDHDTIDKPIESRKFAFVSLTIFFYFSAK